MERRIVAVIESTIGPRLLLGSHLAEAGFAVAVLSGADAARQRISADGLDWIILDETAVQGAGAAVLEQLARVRERPRIAWLGSHPPARPGLIAARFDKPLDYEEIARVLSATSARRAARSRIGRTA